MSFNSDDIKTIYDNEPVESIKELTKEEYQPACCTPLYDAMGNSLNKLRKIVAEEDSVLVTIITDGYENASVEYNQPTIKKFVDELKAKGWVFTYIGANQDVEKVAATISITNTLSFDYTPEGTSDMFANEACARSRYFDSLSFCTSVEERNKLAQEDYFSK